MSVIEPREIDPPIVVVLRAPDASRFVSVAEALIAGGARCIEVTMTSAGAVEAIASIRAAASADVHIACGTARTHEHIDRAAEAGADLVVSQITDERLIEHAARVGIPYVPGALTPTEIVRAVDAGAAMVKVSPIGPVGGAEYLRELTGPLPGVDFFPTGGVRPLEVADYLRAGAALVGLSGLLLGNALQPTGDLRALTERTRNAVDAVSAGPTPEGANS